MLKGKRILLGVTGGIAAYKALQLVRLLKAADADVQVVMSESAQQFVSALSFQALTGLPVRSQLFDSAAEAAMGHIELARWADLVLIAPATANVMAKLAAGLADDLLTTVCLATPAPVAIAPAMNHLMWSKPATQSNVRQLMGNGLMIWGPESGEQACGDTGVGRLLEPESLVERIIGHFTPLEMNLTVLITAGPTHEAIDPVRFVGNHSSGKMGYAIAEAFRDLGAKVQLVSGPVALVKPHKVERVFVRSALQMHQAVFDYVASCDIFIACAAVADYRPEKVPKHKIKKNKDRLHLTLVKNPDILADVAASRLAPFCVGFAAETENLFDNAHKKRLKKGIQMIAANLVGQQQGGFAADENALTVLWDGGKTDLLMKSKTQLAQQLAGLILEHYDATDSTKNS